MSNQLMDRAPDQTVDLDAYEGEFSPVRLVPELLEDQAMRIAAAQFIGSRAVDQTTSIETSENPKSNESLLSALKRAHEGDPEAYKMVEANVRTDVIERTIKAGHIMSVEMGINASGKIIQYGQELEAVHGNSLLQFRNSPKMRERTEAETLNAFRLQKLFDVGFLEDNYFVVISRAADNMTTQDMSDVGFFTDTMTCVIQVTGANGNKITIESAFVAGISQRGEIRDDAQTASRLGQYLGVDLTGLTAAALIRTPLLVPKHLLPGGAIDVASLWDRSTQKSTFFGQAKSKQDYDLFKQKCQEREDFLQPKVDTITRKLIAVAPYLKTKREATKRLAKLSEDHMLQQAAFDYSIDPRVFGEVAAPHLVESRKMFEKGDLEAGLKKLEMAKKTAKSGSCPDGEEKEKKIEDCEFISQECPVCKKKNVKTIVTKHAISGSCGCKVSK